MKTSILKAVAVVGFLLLAGMALAPMVWAQKPGQGGGTTAPPPKSKTTLKVTQNTGDFINWVNEITVNSPQKVTLLSTTQEPGVKAARYEVSTTPWPVTLSPAVSQANVIASGPLPVGNSGNVGQFQIDLAKFIPATPPQNALRYYVRVISLGTQDKPLGLASPAVRLTYKKNTNAPVQFGPNAVFPSVEIVSYEEQIGVVPQTQLHFARAYVRLRVSNKGKTATDPMWLAVKDNNLLMRQTGPNVGLPSLKPGTSQAVEVELDAILPPAKSQMPQQQQYSQWNKWYRDRCGVDLRGVMDWRGPQAQAPMNDHSETILAEEGWGNYSKVSSNAAICDSKQCVRPCQIAKNIHKQLEGHTVGYSFFVGQYPRFDAYGQARTSAGAVKQEFTPTTKITVASVSKMVTAIAAVRILDKNGVSLDSPIGPYLPSDWSLSNYVANITFAQLLSQTSGIKHYGNVSQEYASLKTFFTQGVSKSTTTMCQPAENKNPSNPINPNDMSRCYSNYNFAIFRILLPKVAGLAEDSNPLTRPQTLANQYVKLVQENVFDRVGQHGVACRPPSQGPGALSYALAYKYPGTSPGYDWGDISLSCGAAGWYLSVEDIAKVLLSLNAKDGKILSATPAKDQFEIMRQRMLGWDVDTNTELEKNGGYGGGNGQLITTSIAVFGPVTGPRVIGVLFINSDISGGPSAGGNAQVVLEKAYTSALTPKP